MDDIIEFLLELIIEGSIELIPNKKVPKWLRYIIAFVLSLVALTFIIGLIVFGIMLIRESILGGLILLVVGIILLVYGVVEFIKVKRKMNKSKIVIFSDLHYAPEVPINNGSKIGRKLIKYSEPLLEKLTNKINNEIKPDLVLSLGDLIEDFNNHDKDIENLNYIWKELKKIKAPFYSCVGNHDMRSMLSREEVEKLMGYNHSTFSFNIDKLHIVILGTYINNKMGTAEGGIFKTQCISDEDIEWLKQDLAKNDLPTIVCLHFGVAEDDMKGNWWFETCPERALLGNRKELKEILKNNQNIIGVFSGHQHWTKKIVEDGISYYLTGSMTENINDDGIPDGVYFVVEFDGKKIDVIEKHIKL